MRAADTVEPQGDEDEVLDRDMTVEAPPPRAWGFVRVTLGSPGRGVPWPVESPAVR